MKMLRYVPFFITWLIFLVSIIYFWVKNDSSPNVWLWVIFAGLSLIPLASRLKIGNWIDFGKNVDNQSEKDNIERDKLINISNYNISLATEEASRAFAEFSNIKTETKSEKFASIEKLTDFDKKIIEFMYNADKALESALPLLQILYAAVKTKIIGKFITMEDFHKILHEIPQKDILLLIEEIKSNFSITFRFKDSEKKAISLFEPVIELINIRRRIEKDETTLPPEDYCKALVRHVNNTVLFLTGMITASTSVVINSSLLLKTSSQPKSNSSLPSQDG